MFGLFRKPAPSRSAAEKLYETVVGQARMPALYSRFGVPDTPDGRYDMIMLHAFLLLHRMKAEHAETEEVSQAFFDYMFEDMDKNLREMGAGDVGIARRIKEMAKAFYGRIAAYESGLAGDAGMLEAALRRNVFRHGAPGDSRVDGLAAYVRDQARQLAAQPTADMCAGTVHFDAPPADS